MVVRPTYFGFPDLYPCRTRALSLGSLYIGLEFVMRYVLLLFILMPIIEIAVLLRVGAAIGWLSALAVVILTAIVGTLMLRQQGLTTLSRAQQRLAGGEMPAEQLLEGLFLMFGGALLLTPGFVTDAMGFLCLVPISRQAMVRYIKSRSLGMVGVASPGRPMGAGTGTGSGARPGIDPRSRTGTTSDAGSTRRASGEDIIDGDYQRLD